MLNHNLETVARLQRRRARRRATRGRSRCSARAKDAGLVTKSGLILGMGETADEVRAAIADLRAVGVDILTLGQYLRPSGSHLPVAKWWHPDEFAAIGEYARGDRASPTSRRGRSCGRATTPVRELDRLVDHRGLRYWARWLSGSPR